MLDWLNDLNPTLLFLSESYPLAYYGAVVCLIIIGVHVAIWGMNAISNERLAPAVRALQPAAFVSLALAVVFIAFCVQALTRNDALASASKTARPGPAAQIPSALPAVNKPSASVNPSETALPVWTQPDIEPSPKRTVAVDFTPDGLSALLSLYRFTLDKTSLTMGRTTETWSRAFDGQSVSLEAQSTEDGLWRIALNVPSDAAGVIGPEQELFVREASTAFFRDQLPLADGIIHSPSWSPARCVVIGDFYIVKTGVTGAAGSRIIIIHKNDPNLRDNTRQLADEQKSTDWLAFRRWK